MKSNTLISLVVAIIITALTIIIPVTSMSTAVFFPEGQCAVCGSTYPVKTDRRGLPFLVVSHDENGTLGDGSTFHPKANAHVDFETYLATNPVSYSNLALDFLSWFTLSFALVVGFKTVAKKRK